MFKGVSESETEMLLPWPEVGQRCGPGAGPDSSVTLSISAASLSAFSSASGLAPAPAGPAQQTLATFEVRMLKNK